MSGSLPAGAKNAGHCTALTKLIGSPPSISYTFKDGCIPAIQTIWGYLADNLKAAQTPQQNPKTKIF